MSQLITPKSAPKGCTIRPLTQDEIDQYHENGYVIVHGLFVSAQYFGVAEKKKKTSRMHMGS